MMLRMTLWILAAAAGLALSARGTRPALGQSGVVALVNGATVSEADLALRLKPDHQRGQAAAPPEATSDRRKNVLETVIDEELAAQRAHELGFDRDPEYLAGLAPFQAQLDAYRRKALGELLAANAVKSSAGVTDAEAKEFFEQHAAQLKTQVQVWQILRRSEESIAQAQEELAAAPSFEAYAQSQFPQLAPTEHPWDLGYLRFEQLPEQWRDVVYKMKKGEVSPIIRGPKDRFWILRLVDVREDPTVTFETAKPTLVEALKGKKLTALHARTASELRSTAKVVYVQPPQVH